MLKKMAYQVDLSPPCSIHVPQSFPLKILDPIRAPHSSITHLSITHNLLLMF
jgi:hypothetical protein